MLGLRGLHPDLEIGGFDTAFAEIAPRLVARGHSVIIYCRANAHSLERRPAEENGVTLEYMPSPGGKNYAAIVSTLLAVLHAFTAKRYDVWFFVNVGMGHHAALARLSGRPVVMNVDGLDWTRGKWGPIARFYFQSAARSAVRFCSALITDAVAMQEYYRERLGRETEMIAYGAEIGDSRCAGKIAAFGIAPREYHLIVSRFIPENSLIEMLEGFRQSGTSKRLVVVGNASYEDSYQVRLREIAASDERIIMVGLVKDQSVLRELWCNCSVYMHGHSVGGTNPHCCARWGLEAACLHWTRCSTARRSADRGGTSRIPRT